MLSLLWMCLNKPVEVNLHKLKTELQFKANGWDSLDRLYGMCLNMFGEKRTRGFCYGTPSVEAALFLQEEGDLMFKSV